MNTEKKLTSEEQMEQACACLYIVCDKAVACDVNKKVKGHINKLNDRINYLETIIREAEMLTRTYPNNMQLGSELREYFKD